MKSWMFILCDIVSLIIGVLILNSYFLIFGKNRWKQKWKKLLCAIAFVILGTIINIFNQIQIVYALLMFLLIVAYSLVFEVKVVKRIYSTLLIYVVFIFSETGVFLILSLISSLTIAQLQGNILAYMQAAIVAKVIFYVIIRLISSKVTCKNNSIPKVIMAAFIVLPLTTFAILYFTFEYVYTNSDIVAQIILFILAMLLIAANMIVFLIFDYISKQKDKEKNVEIKAQQLEYERQYYSDLYEKQTQSDKITHDLKSKYYAIHSLMDKDVKKAKKELDSIVNVFEQVKKIKITGDVGIDALLNHKIMQAKELGIEIDAISCISNVDKFDNIDLCVILGNLLDNSIEACNKLDENIAKYINIQFKQELQYLIISIENPCENNVDPKRTSKQDQIHHGFGINNIKEIIDKYNGVLDINIQDNKFKVTIVMGD